MPDLNYANQKLASIAATAFDESGVPVQVSQTKPFPVDIVTGGAVTYTPDDVQASADVLGKYTPTIDPNHYLTFTRNCNGQAVVAITANPLFDDTVSYVDFIQPLKQPMAMEIELAISGRARQWHAGVLLGNFHEPLEALPAPVNVTSWWQHNTDYSSNYVSASGPYMTMALETPLPSNVYLGDWICVSGANIAGVQYANNNLVNGAIRHISDDRTRITVSYADEAVITSANIATGTPTAGTMKICFFDNMLGANSGMGIRFSGSTATSAACFTKMGGDAQIGVGNTVNQDQRVTFANTAPSNPVAVSGQVDCRPSSRYRLENRIDEACFYDCGVDVSGGSLQTARNVRTTVKPNADTLLYPRIYMRVPKSTSKQVARILSITKSANNVAVVVTEEPHGLLGGEAITIKGVYDTTNFASITGSAPITYISPTSFSFSHGSAVTASSYGGTVHVCNSALDQQGILSQYVTNANWNKTTQFLVLTAAASASWATVVTGDHVYVGGVRSAAGQTGLDGMWKVWNNSTTTLVLEPLFDIYGNRISPNPDTMNIAAGGSVVLCPSVRIHDLSVESWTEHRVMIDGQGTGRVDKAMPINGAGGYIGVSASTSVSTSGSGGIHVRPAIAGITDVAGGTAITSTNTGSSIVNDFGNGFQVTFPVTAVSGTAPTLDIRIEESFDGGTNWVTLYEMQRITATGSYNTPILRATGRHIRYVRTIGGTSPSFSMGIIRNTLPSIQAEPQKRLMDRSIVLTTLNSVTPTLFSGAANNVQLVINVGAITTTAPQIQIEGSEDGANWYPIGAPLAAVASSTVEQTIGKSATFARARVSTAGVGVTAGYVCLKAWS